jgi:hypothetical protein
VPTKADERQREEDRQRAIDREYNRPEDVPPDLTPLERAIIASRNVIRWAAWSLETGPAPEIGDKLVDVGPEKSSK